MISLSLLIAVNLGFTTLAIIFLVKWSEDSDRRDLAKSFAMLEIVWSMFSLLLGTALIFSILETLSESSTFLKITGGVNIIKLLILFGFGIVHLLLSSIIFLRIAKSKTYK